MSKADPRIDELERAMREQTLVNISRSPRNADRVDGFVVAMGSKWVLIAQTRDGGYFDGLTAVRLRDVVKVADDSTFAERFARSQPQWPPSAPEDLDLGKTRRLIETLSKASELIGIEQERRHKSAMQWIGAVDEIESGWLWLREVRSDATWHDEALGYKLSRITKVVVLNDYQLGLTAIAGQVPDGDCTGLPRECFP
ncbi:hypothetical protein [Nocardioides gilvus]|uniref:hypothetical protein n=1 Tax=Nocardioides gilvus TaxID=1735589 RepID=UPI000D749826|nr:hypothetical protein [Nocardioides gilvus]